MPVPIYLQKNSFLTVFRQGDLHQDAVIVSSLPAFGDALTGSETFAGPVLSAMPVFGAALTGVELYGAIASAMPVFGDALAGAETFSGSVSSAMPVFSDALAGTETFSGSVSSGMPAFGTSIAAWEFYGTISSDMTLFGDSLAGSETFSGSVSSAMPAFGTSVSASKFYPTDYSPSFMLIADAGVTSSAGKISQWADQSGVGDANRNATQATSNVQPTINTSDAAYNHRNSVGFASQFMATGTWSSSLAQPATWYIVGQCDQSTTEVFFDGIVSANRQATYTSGAGNITEYAGTVQAYTGVTITSPSGICSVYDSTAHAIYVNNFTTAVGSNNPGTNALTGATIGALFNGTFPLKTGSKIAFIAAFPSAHDSTHRSQMKTWINLYYGLSIT